MYKIINTFISVLCCASLLLSCTPDEHSLGAIDLSVNDLQEGKAYSVTFDTNNPNRVIMKSLLDPQYTPLWIHPMGYSQEEEFSITIPFPGEYEIQFGAITRGGPVYGEVKTYKIDTFDEEFWNHEFWTLLTGGTGKQKTWYLDLDENGQSAYFAGPLYFYGTDDSWLTVTLGQDAGEGKNSWSYCPDYAGNSWLMPTGNYGQMTFSLLENTEVEVVYNMFPARGTEKGVFMIYPEQYTMTMTNATPLHDAGRDGQVVDWRDIKIMSLTEHSMQLGVIRDPVLSNEDPATLVYNYVSKEYYDNWVLNK